MNAALGFLASSAGRVVRAVAGVILIVVALFVAEGALAWILALVGLVPLVAGLLDFCVFAPLFQLPFVGERLRNTLEEEE
ncbi:MAG: YgaP family membrane protein [Anaerolineae bacterium]